jgi:hypothetical protein
MTDNQIVEPDRARIVSYAEAARAFLAIVQTRNSEDSPDPTGEVFTVGKTAEEMRRIIEVGADLAALWLGSYTAVADPDHAEQAAAYIVLGAHADAVHVAACPGCFEHDGCMEAQSVVRGLARV